MSNRAVALVGAAFILAAGIWIDRLYNELELQKAQYETRIAALAQEVSEKEKARAEAVATAERAARERLEKETARVAALSAELSDARKKLAKERQTFDARLQKVAVTARHNCAGLSRDWVRLYNEALGLAGSGGGSGSQDTDPAGTAQNAGQTGPARAGVRGDALATPEDVLAHVRDYGGYCRGLEVQLATLARVVSP